MENVLETICVYFCGSACVCVYLSDVTTTCAEPEMFTTLLHSLSIGARR